MRHRNSVRQLGRTHSHRKAMMANILTSLFEHERVITTRQKGKELKKVSDRLITRAKMNLEKTEDSDKQLHNKRIAMKMIKNRNIIKKLFEDIAPRFAERNGGYTRMYLLGRRNGDSAEMAMVELVEGPIRTKKAEVKEADSSKDKKKKKIRKKDKDS